MSGDSGRDPASDESARTAYLKLKTATWDRTTGLPAYGVLVETLRTLLETRRRLGVVHVEPAGVELVESIYGWQVFDSLFAGLAGELRDSIGEELPEDALLTVARVPGDRFVVFLPTGPGGREPDPAHLDGIAGRIKARLDRVVEREGLALLGEEGGVRVGYALLSPNPYYRFERRVHAAVDEARGLPGRHESERERFFRAELERIIRDESVSVVFQPVVDLRTRSILGFEAFSRGPKDTVFEAPRAMFALSDRLGTAVDLDRLCRDAAFRASAAGVGGRLFVNVRPENLADPRPLTGAQAGGAGASRAGLVLEVSERTLGDRVSAVAGCRDALRDAGLGLAVDDVGTGYASLLTLERLKPDFIKVDAMLVRGIDRNPIQQDLFASLVEMGRRIGAAVVAVGVETEAEAGAALELGARYAQGYLFAEPAPIERFTGGSDATGH